MSNIAAGWYDDGRGATRWWDGQAWTERTASTGTATAPSQVKGAAAGNGQGNNLARLARGFRNRKDDPEKLVAQLAESGLSASQQKTIFELNEKANLVASRIADLEITLGFAEVENENAELATGAKLLEDARTDIMRATRLIEKLSVPIADESQRNRQLDQVRFAIKSAIGKLSQLEILTSGGAPKSGDTPQATLPTPAESAAMAAAVSGFLRNTLGFNNVQETKSTTGTGDIYWRSDRLVATLNPLRESVSDLLIMDITVAGGEPGIELAYFTPGDYSQNALASADEGNVALFKIAADNSIAAVNWVAEWKLANPAQQRGHVKATTPAGWYDDGRGATRWWDGQKWTAQTKATTFGGKVAKKLAEAKANAERLAAEAKANAERLAAEAKAEAERKAQEKREYLAATTTLPTQITIGKPYPAVANAFRVVGFKNIVTSPLKDLTGDIMTDEGLVKVVTIDGEIPDMTEGNRYYRNKPVIIQYHSMPNTSLKNEKVGAEPEVQNQLPKSGVVPDSMKPLQELLTAGIITRDEFAAAEARLAENRG